MPDPHPTEDTDDPRVAALLAWRQELIDSGAVSARSFKEAHLHLVLRSGRTDVAEIAAMLPPSVADHAEHIAHVLAQPAAPATGGRHAASDGTPHPDPGTDAGAGAGTDADGDDADVEQTAMLGAATAAAPRRTDETALSADDFAGYTLGAQDTPAHTIAMAPRPGTDTAPAALQLRWPPYLPPPGAAETVVLYRLISAEDTAPYSPDRAELLTATTAITATDPRPTESALRHYQIWVNAAATRAEALAAQPILHAATILVSPVTQPTITEDNGRVIGQWGTPQGISAVHIYRVPAEDATRDGPQYRILAGTDTLAGFVDTEVIRGQRYRYRVRAAATVDGVIRLSQAVEADVEISAVLEPVTTVAVTTTSADGALFDVTWTPPPAGRVAIYRSQQAPAAGADNTELPEQALEQVGLAADLRLTQPVAAGHDPQGRPQSVMGAVSWPTGWSRAYLTPVTLLGGRARLGKTISAVRTGVIRDVELAEYCTKQVLTFDWPDGAAAVLVGLAPKGHDPRNGLTGKSFEITREDYQKYGGMQLAAGQLPAAGCSLHLAPVAFSGGRRVTGAIRSIEYHGLLRLRYAVLVRRDPNGLPLHATVAVRSEHELPGSPAFVLVHNSDRVPLSVHDGHAVDVAPINEHGQLIDAASKELRFAALSPHGTGELWAADLRGRHGWIRLFVNTPSAARLRTIALLDPPVGTLRLAAVAP